MNEPDEQPFAVIYRWSIDPAFEQMFVDRWATATRQLRAEHGALGSCLCRAENGDFVAFARWPSEAARARAFADRGPPQPWPGVLSFEELRLTIERDLLLSAR